MRKRERIGTTYRGAAAAMDSGREGKVSAAERALRFVFFVD